MHPITRGAAGVQFLLDGAALANEVLGPPYAVRWNAGPATPGPHTLSAIARDLSGNTTRAANVSVTVSKPGSVPGGPVVPGLQLAPIVAVHAILLTTGNVLAWTDYAINQGKRRSGVPPRIRPLPSP